MVREPAECLGVKLWSMPIWSSGSGYNPSPGTRSHSDDVNDQEGGKP
ncbi:hypothetical protein OK074_5044 [Actinobacteria bacterium OK074]|nr:hypothetical protein OK074_5044 [Actinobacteria bacterium OK074]